MATIRVNEDAPQEAVHFTLPTVAFDLAPGDTFETDDFRVIDEAVTHPWLAVDMPAEEAFVPRYRDNYPDPEFDPLSADNPVNQAAMTTEAAIAFEDQRDAEEAEIFNAEPAVPQPEFADEVVEVADPDAEPADEAPADEVPADEPFDLTLDEPFDPTATDTTTEDPNF